MLRHFRYFLLRRTSPVKLSHDNRIRAESIPWEHYAPPELVRRRRNLIRRLGDFPAEPSRIRPTRLGNVLRAYEDQTGREPVETFVLEVLDQLPLDLRAEYDENRNRLDLYCSMIFVAAFTAVFAAVWLGQGPGPAAHTPGQCTGGCH